MVATVLANMHAAAFSSAVAQARQTYITMELKVRLSCHGTCQLVCVLKGKITTFMLDVC